MAIMDLFPTDEAAEEWVIETRWSNGEIACVRCGLVNVQTKTTHPRMPFRCRDCRQFFSPKTGTPMANSNLYRVWAIAIYLLTTGLKGTASMKLHRDLGHHPDASACRITLPSRTASGSKSTGKRTPTASSRSGRCSSAATTAPSTTSPRSIWTATSASSRDGTTPARSTPRIRCGLWCAGWRGSGSVMRI